MHLRPRRIEWQTCLGHASFLSVHLLSCKEFLAVPSKVGRQSRLSSQKMRNKTSQSQLIRQWYMDVYCFQNVIQKRLFRTYRPYEIFLELFGCFFNDCFNCGRYTYFTIIFKAWGNFKRFLCWHPFRTFDIILLNRLLENVLNFNHFSAPSNIDEPPTAPMLALRSPLPLVSQFCRNLSANDPS